MKHYIIPFLFALTGCSSYTVSKVSDEQVMVSKTTQILFFWHSTISTCDLNKEGLFESCKDNIIKTEDDILKKQEKQQKLEEPVIIKEPMKKETLIKAESIIKESTIVKENKPSKTPRRDIDTGKIYIGIGPSTSSDDVNLPDIDSAKFNYSFAYLKKEFDYMYGGIYHVSAYRMYGYLKNPGINTTFTEFEQQSNINLLGASVRKYLASTDESSPYLRFDGGLAWMTTGKSVILMPMEHSSSMGFGANIGAGLSLKTSFGSVNIDIYHTVYDASKPGGIESGMTNFTLGLMF